MEEKILHRDGKFGNWERSAVAVVIPTYNEEQNIVEVVEGKKLPSAWIVVADDASNNSSGKKSGEIEVSF